MKMIDVSKVRVFRVCLFVLFMLFMRIGWASMMIAPIISWILELKEME